MRKINIKWILIAAAVLLVVVLSMTVFGPSSNSSDHYYVEGNSSRRPTRTVQENLLVPTPEVLYEVYFDLNSSYSAPILFEQATSAATQVFNNVTGLKGVEPGCQLRARSGAAAVRTEEDTRTFELLFTDDKAHPDRPLKNVIASLGRVSLFRPREVLSVRAGAAAPRPAGKSGVHVILAHSEAQLDLLSWQTLYVFSTNEAARGFVEQQWQGGNVTTHAAATGAEGEGAAAQATTAAATMLAMPFTQGECAPPPFLCANGAYAREDVIVSADFSDAHVQHIKKSLAQMYKTVADFFLPLPLLSGDGGDEQQLNTFCSKSGDSAPDTPSGALDLSCTLYVVASGMYKFPSAGADRVASSAGRRKGTKAAPLRTESMKVTTVTTLDDSNFGTPRAGANVPFCKNISFSKDFWRINPDESATADLQSIVDDEKGKTIVRLLLVASVYAFLMSFIVGRWMKVK